MKKVYLIKNKAHSLMESQQEILYKKFPVGEWKLVFINVPEKGWNKEDQKKIAVGLNRKVGSVIFVSPVPVLMGMIMSIAAYRDGYAHGMGMDNLSSKLPVYVFHNDRREKKELPNGKIIMTVAREGWELVQLA